jgi:hypothetical protein
MQIIARASAVGLHLRPRQIFQYQTLAELAVVADVTPSMEALQGSVIGPPPAVEKDASDHFPLAGLSQEQLAQAFGEVTFTGEDV